MVVQGDIATYISAVAATYRAKQRTVQRVIRRSHWSAAARSLTFVTLLHHDAAWVSEAVRCVTPDLLAVWRRIGGGRVGPAACFFVLGRHVQVL
jgi:hypothetical protein